MRLATRIEVYLHHHSLQHQIDEQTTQTGVRAEPASTSESTNCIRRLIPGGSYPEAGYNADRTTRVP